MHRIVSLVPSSTETVCHLGLEEHVVGCTSFCSEPPRLRKKVESVGGTKNPDIERIAQLHPTHVLVNTEENTAQAIIDLKNRLQDANIVETFPQCPNDTIECVTTLAATFGLRKDDLKLERWHRQIQAARSKVIEQASTLDELLVKINSGKPIEFAYFIWRNPWMVAGDQTYISNLLREGGLKNLCSTSNKLTERYPVTDPHTIGAGQGDDLRRRVLFFSSEPFNFKMRHIDEFCQLANVHKSQCLKVDGKALSWHGVRLLQGYEEVLRIQEMLLTSLRQPSIAMFGQ